MTPKRIYKIGGFAAIVNLSISTLRVWKPEGKLVPKGTATASIHLQNGMSESEIERTYQKRFNVQFLVGFIRF